MVRRKIIRIDENLCNGCGNCVIPCAEGAIEIVNGKARLIKVLRRSRFLPRFAPPGHDHRRKAEAFSEEAVEDTRPIGPGCRSSS